MQTLLIAALVAISTLGSEGTDPVVLFLYRSIIFAIVFWCLRDLHRRGEPFVSPGFLTTGAAGTLLMLSFLRNPSTFEGFYMWYQFVLFAVLFVVLAAYSRTQPVAWKLKILYVVGAIQAVYLIAGLIAAQRPVKAGFVNPDYFGSFLLVGLSISLSIALFRHAVRERALGIIGSCFFYYGIIQTSSRGATLAALLIVLVAAMRYGTRSRRARIVTIAGFCVVLAGGALLSPALVRKFTDFGSTNAYNYMRPKIWASTLHVIGDHPLFGVGLGQFVHVSRRYAPPLEGAGVARYMQRPGIAHSEYLQYAAEAGLPAALLLMSLAGYVVWLTVSRARTCPADSRVIQEAAIFMVAGLAGHALVDNNWIVPVMASGAVVFSLADVLPYRDWSIKMEWRPVEIALTVVLVLAVYAHSTLIPAAGLWFDQAGDRAFAGNDLNRAESNFRTAEAILPVHVPLLDEMGMLYLARFQQTHDRHWIGMAEDSFTRAAAAGPDVVEPLRHMERALIMSLTENVEIDRSIHPQIAAIDRQILRVDPFDPFVRKNLAEALYRDGRRQEAEHELEQALQFEPNFVPAYLTMANWETEAGNSARAAQYRETAQAISARFRDVKLTEPYERFLLGQH